MEIHQKATNIINKRRDDGKKKNYAKGHLTFFIMATGKQVFCKRCRPK